MSEIANASSTAVVAPAGMSSPAATLQSIAAVPDEVCESSPIAMSMRRAAREALGLPVVTPRDNVRPPLGGGEPIEIPTCYSDAGSWSAKRKASCVRQWGKFLRSGCAWSMFTNDVYEALHGPCAFTAHSDRLQFYRDYFRTWSGLRSFIGDLVYGFNCRRWGAGHQTADLVVGVYAVTVDVGLRPNVEPIA